MVWWHSFPIARRAQVAALSCLAVGNGSQLKGGHQMIWESIAILSIGAATCQGDLTNDGFTGVEDLLVLLGAWGDCPEPCETCAADLNGDCAVGVPDLLILLGDWGCVMPHSAILTFSTFLSTGVGPPWPFASNAAASDDNLAGTSLTTGESSSYLVGHTPTDTSEIPSDARIVGMEPIIEASRGGGNGDTAITEVFMYQGGAIAGNNMGPMSGLLTAAHTDYTFGGSDELSGLTWTRAQIDTCGVAMRMANSDGKFNSVGQVDFLRVRAHYILPPGGSEAGVHAAIGSEAGVHAAPGAVAGVHAAIGAEAGVGGA